MAGKKNKKIEPNKVDLVDGPKHEKKNKPRGEEKLVHKPLQTYLPGMELAKDEKLEVDLSAYVMLHELNTGWPCLSFDNVVRKEGDEERVLSFPASGYLITGSQADRRNRNELYLFRYTNLHKTRPPKEEDNYEEEEGKEDAGEGPQNEHESSSDDDTDTEEGELGRKDPRHYCVSIPVDGAVNRIRATNFRLNEQLCTVAASWSETGRVDLWDLTAPLSELEKIDITSTPSSLARHALKPIASIKCHTKEGFAIAWSSIQAGRLLTGDGAGKIHLTEVGSSGVHISDTPFQSHNGSVEDLHWSPNEGTVFASAGVDGTVRIWDIRMPRHQAALTRRVYSCDVNVISWNRHQNHLLASGGDDGMFSIWDLRTWGTNLDENNVDITPLIGQTWHRQAITSIEWNPHDALVLAVAGADDQLSIWDFSVESTFNGNHDEDINQINVGGSIVTVPNQLLFIHQGQQDIKELHWHPLMGGMLISTAASGFNIFKTISV